MPCFHVTNGICTLFTLSVNTLGQNRPTLTDKELKPTYQG
ncbi:hypothetical protein VPHK348_0035 [Vibrio phage K348]